MMRLLCILAVCLSFVFSSSINEYSDVNFDTLEVSAQKIKDNKKHFLSPGATVSKGDEIGAKSTQSLDSVVRSISGSFTQIDEANGGISVNIRSMTGLGRVNTMIDGVTQTYFGTSSDRASGVHSGIIGTSAFGALIDQNFLVGIDLSKGTFSGANSGIMGSANFRTIGVDDVVQGGRNFGFLGKYSYGSNAIGPSYMGSVGGKYILDNGFKFGTLYAYSGKNTSQNYTDGGGNKSYFDEKMLKQKPKNHLAKLEISNDEHLAVFSYRKYDNHLAKRKIKSDNYGLNYSFDKNDFLSLKFIGAYQKTDQNFDKGAQLGLFPLYKDGMMASQNKALNFDLSNGFKFDIKNTKYEARFGINFLDNKYKRVTNDPDWKTFTTEFGMIPQGKQKILSYYLNNAFEYDKFNFDANLNISKFKLMGEKGECASDNHLCFPKEAGKFTSKDTNLNYSLLASYNLNEFFMPFVSYSKATRPLNVQEVFTSGTYDTNINTNLKPETAKTFQVGFNSFKQGFLKDNDTFGLKMLCYKTDVDNYIYDRYVMLGGAFIARDNDKAKFKGFEIEASYDAEIFYVNLAYTYQKVLKLPVSDSQKIDNMLGMGGGQTQFAQLPQDYATLDIGTRLFNEKLTLGSVIKYTGKAKRIDPRSDYINTKPNQIVADPKTENLPNIPTIIDLYAVLEPRNNLQFKFEVQNLTDKNYMDALYTMNSNELQQNNPNMDDSGITLFENKARGRTYMVSFVYKF